MNMETEAEYFDVLEQDRDVEIAEDQHEDEVLGVIFYVVGDKFKDFSDSNIILPYSEALSHLKIVAQIAKCIVIGQGVSTAEILHLQETLKLVSATRNVKIIHRGNEKIKKELVDKTEEKNVLITLPRSITPSVFESHLIIDDDCAEMVDCHAGEHVQGALLIEAAKQMFMACVRTSTIAPDFMVGAEPTRFTLSKLDVNFENFVFPLAAKIKLSLNDKKINGSFASGSATISIYQFERRCCEITFHANAYSAKFFSSLERRSAIKIRNRLDYTNTAYI